MRINLGSVNVTDNERKAIALRIDGANPLRDEIPLSRVRKASREEVRDFFMGAYELSMTGPWDDLEEITGAEVREW